MEIALPLIEIGLLAILVLAALLQRVAPAERAWLGRVLLAALALRIAAATLFALLPAARVFHEDASGYEHFGLVIASGWEGSGRPFVFAKGPNHGFYYFGAAVYFVFGAFRPMLSYVNCLLGTVNVFLVYRLTRRFFQLPVARRAALLVAFFPSVVLWSTLAIKDTLATLLIVLTLSSCVRLKERLTPGNLLLTLLPMVAIQPIRFYMLYFLGLAVLGSLLVERGKRVATGVPKFLLLGGLGLAALVAVGLSRGVEEGTKYLDLARISEFRHGMATTANSGYAASAETESVRGALAFLPVGMAYLMLSPFPWQFTSMRALFAAPETVVWWLMLPALVRGLAFTFRRRFAATSPMILFTFALLPAYSLVHGNVGSGFRQRAQFFVFLFIFTAVGQFARQLKRRGRSPDLLLNPGPEERR